MEIVVRYSAVDGAKLVRTFKSLAGARRFAVKMVGETPEIGSFYAVDFDGVGKVVVEGCTLKELFAAPVAKAKATPIAQEYDGEYDNDWYDPDAAYERHLETKHAGKDNAEAEAHGRYEDII